MNALVLFSGGQDSSTALAWALKRYNRVETVGFEYGQRHLIELTCRKTILGALQGERLGADHLVRLEFAQAGSPREDGLPETFIPGRNLLFFLHAAIIAERRGLRAIVGGMCETDFSGYPDCRDDAIKAMQVAVNIGMQARFIFETPLMWLDKRQSWHLAAELGGEKLVDLILEESHTCYAGDRSVRHAWGYGCGACPACKLREKGWVGFSSEMSGL